MQTKRTAKALYAAVERGERTRNEEMFIVGSERVQEDFEITQENFGGPIGDVITTYMKNDIMGEWILFQDAGDFFKNIGHFSTWKA